MDHRLQLRVQRYGWDRASELYDRAWSRHLEPAQDLLLEMAGPAGGERILEVACGSGLATVEAAQRVGPSGEVVATDLSEGMIEQAREAILVEELSNVSFHRMDAQSLDFPDASFDAALCALGLMYVPDPGAALRETMRVLRPGGRAVAAVWGERKRCGWAEIFPIVDACVETEVCPLFFQLGTGNSLRNEMESAGFRGVETRRLSTTLHFTSAEDVLEASFVAGPVAMAHSRFDDATRRRVYAEYLDSIDQYANGDGYSIPGEFVVVRGEVE